MNINDSFFSFRFSEFGMLLLCIFSCLIEIIGMAACYIENTSYKVNLFWARGPWAVKFSTLFISYYLFRGVLLASCIWLVAHLFAYENYLNVNTVKMKSLMHQYNFQSEMRSMVAYKYVYSTCIGHGNQMGFWTSFNSTCDNCWIVQSNGAWLFLLLSWPTMLSNNWIKLLVLNNAQNEIKKKYNSRPDYDSKTLMMWCVIMKCFPIVRNERPSESFTMTVSWQFYWVGFILSMHSRRHRLP